MLVILRGLVMHTPASIRSAPSLVALDFGDWSFVARYEARGSHLRRLGPANLAARSTFHIPSDIFFICRHIETRGNKEGGETRRTEFLLTLDPERVDGKNHAIYC